MTPVVYVAGGGTVRTQRLFDLESSLFFGDNLEVLRQLVRDDSVDLVYLDPPFNPNATNNMLFRHVDGSPAAALIKAFDDAWHWSIDSERSFKETVDGGGEVSRALRSFRELLGPNDLMAYLSMMAPRLVELRRVLRSTGSIYLHCDPTASHYLKLLMDAVFGPANFRNEIIWKRTGAHSGAHRFGPAHDVILFYTVSGQYVWNVPYVAYSDDHLKKFKHNDPLLGPFSDEALTGPGRRSGESGQPWGGHDPTATGRHWQPASYAYDKYRAVTGEDLATYPFLERLTRLDEAGLIFWPARGSVPRLKRFLVDQHGAPAQDVWTDVDVINSRAAERLGYPTQKPLALLERIIAASSNPGDTVLDPFCGCGTTVDAAQKLGRRWIGIDITARAMEVIQDRLGRFYPDLHPALRGIPPTIEEVDFLADRDKYGFQQWVCDLLGIQADIRRGADRGIDGEIVRYEIGGTVVRAIVSVKGGAVNVTQVRDLRGTAEREGAQIGIFVTRKPPTRPMVLEAVEAGLTANGIPKIQILTAADIMDGKRPVLPLPLEVGERASAVEDAVATISSLAERRGA